MKSAPIPKYVLVHTVQWKKYSFNREEDPIVLQNVRIDSTNMFFEQAQMQTVWANWVLTWDSVNSTPLPEGKEFAIGDTIIWDEYPRVMQITNIKPVYAMDSTKAHHYEITLK